MEAVVGGQLGSTLLAQYKFENKQAIGWDSSENGQIGVAKGSNKPVVQLVGGRMAATFQGGAHGNSYLELPATLLKDVNDFSGLTVTAWVYLQKGSSVWERIFDFGSGQMGPYIFLTRNLRGTCFGEADLVVHPAKSFQNGEWLHVAFTLSGTEGGTLSSGGSKVYVNGELVADGSISQTSSGQYGQLKRFFEAFSTSAIKGQQNYIGHSRFGADDDFSGALSDFRIYKSNLSQDQVIEVMCDALTDQEITEIAMKKYVDFESHIVTKDMVLPTQLMGNRVQVTWKSSHEGLLSHQGKLGMVTEPMAVHLEASFMRGSQVFTQKYVFTVIPEGLAPYELTIEGNKSVMDVSETLYGLFYEDINNAADGGIYAELVHNRSFEAFSYDTYDGRSGENGISTGRNHTPLSGWTGDLEGVTVQTENGLKEVFQCVDLEVNHHYISVHPETTLYNRGFSDTNGQCAIYIRRGENYRLTLWAKNSKMTPARMTVSLVDAQLKPMSDVQTICLDQTNWQKYGATQPIVLTGLKTGFGQLKLHFDEAVSIDMISLVPENVWGANEETDSETAHMNYKSNSNYRLRKDLVLALKDLHPTFLRFPGGCISEGSYIWDNVYDWKESVGPIESRKENYNVWGYMMTMGLGYMEYFQLAEDLKATPLPVMACGVLCQARSDYANPAGGALREKYIRNFTDLIDFALSSDFENNEWAKLRLDMGHPETFDLRYLGVGNENWGTEFFANFEIFKKAIDDFMLTNYPHHLLTILSTVGAQADDDSYQQGWKFLAGKHQSESTIRFTDGVQSTEEKISWYEGQKDYMDTIADEHYYRPNKYLVNNVDRYNYYDRAYLASGALDESKTSKVFVGEYASTDKNTLAGAVAEAAVMTGFENNSDVVRLAATAPLFNKVLTDGSYRWTPDCIWFDDETLWKTPNYYVQQLFAKYIGKQVLSTAFEHYKNGQKQSLVPYGGIEIGTGNGDIWVSSVKVVSNETGEVFLEQDFRQALNPVWHLIPGAIGFKQDSKKGLFLKGQETGINGLYCLNNHWRNYSVEVQATKVAGKDGFVVGVGLTEIATEYKDVHEYWIGLGGDSTGVKVFKRGIEGYTLGDYASSNFAGNLRAANFEQCDLNESTTITVDFGGQKGKTLLCKYTNGEFHSKTLNYILEAYNHDVFSSVTQDESQVYVKLVNPDKVVKKLRLQLNRLQCMSSVKKITLSGSDDMAHVPNVNGKNNERIVPVEEKIKLMENMLTLDLPGHSVTILVLKQEMS